MELSNIEVKSMKATVLTDNIGSGNLTGEWGLSIFIEYGGKTVLLDAGTTGLFAENAEKLGISLDRVDYAVLSHAHYDHGNGMPRFFEINSRAKLYLQASCRENCYSRKKLFSHYIGLERGMLKRCADRLQRVSGDYEIDKGIWLIPHRTPDLAAVGKSAGMSRREGLLRVPDDFSHEQSLVFDTPGGLVIFNSCSHGGADNIIREVSETFPGKKLLALIGGFHLYRKSDQQVRDFAGRVKETGIGRIYTGHCTGQRAFELLREELGDAAQQLYTGLTMEF